MRKFRPATIRGRLVAVLAVALSAVLVLLGVLVDGELDDYRAAEAAAKDVDLALDVQMMVHELQRERGLTNGLLAGRAADREPLGGQRRRTDEALTRFTAATEHLDTPQLRAARDRLAGLGRTRAEVDGGSAPRDQAFAYYTDGITALAEAAVVPEHSRDRELLRGVAALTALGDAKEATAQSRGFLNGVLSAGRFKNYEFQTFSEIRAEQQAALKRFQHDATPVQQERANAALGSQIAMQAQHVEQYALAAADGRSLVGLDAGTWWSSMTAVIDGVWITQLSIGDEIRDRAAELRDGASADLLTYLLVAALLVAGEIALTLVAVRSITRPLTLLAREAEAMASRRLPEVVTRLRAGDHGLEPPQPVAVPTGSGREILAVAQAFGRVQDTAVQLAAEQAVLRRNTTDSLVNLARRNQNLVRRQLGFISRLEHEEADPTALANLFELDHLATRMRRNAESLLVLVGETGPRPGGVPLHIADVVRAALSEVEDYRRVVLRRMDDAAVAGPAVTELAHLLAELVENALAFSPPDVEVE
ncbi:MAG: ATP-binding protein, partial [Saccharothrix sp.]|nr:ATP-binding protein [Saccharothrix sp.]